MLSGALPGNGTRKSCPYCEGQKTRYYFSNECFYILTHHIIISYYHACISKDKVEVNRIILHISRGIVFFRGTAFGLTDVGLVVASATAEYEDPGSIPGSGEVLCSISDRKFSVAAQSL